MPPPIGYCPAVGFGGRHERSNAELLAAHVAGDRYAFDQLFRRHHRQLHRLARLTSRTSEDADDALQDAMLSAHRGAGSFRYDAAVSSWLHRIVVNACLDRLRRAKAHPTAPLEDVYPVADRTAPDYGPPGGPLGDPSRRTSCLSGLGYPASTPVLGAQPIDIDARPAVLLVIPADTPDKLAVFAVAPHCSAADTGLLASTVVPRA
ncbi:RNA polymerase sigma factor SigM [Mycobacterium tuberculosis]|uniref:RNA polymerase sigma factor SigM n=1 Tax=Mycobacterium tuberculosis TaxID=1773 RepID=UPI00045AAC7C|nr:sigma-70 family RNA polymerase sigma factor SigM [Mycobacterium tuberculosis MAL020211]